MDKKNLKLRLSEILTRGVAEVIERRSLENKLKSGRKLRIKHGIDPTGPNIHIGRAIQFWKLKKFQDMGHKIVFIIGDFTAQIGDASDKQAARKPLTAAEVSKNMKSYSEQIGKILDISKVELRHNSEWLSELSAKELVDLAMNFSAQQLIQRRNFKERWDRSKEIGLHELLYPIFQGYDSVAVKADVEIGGTDQIFNFIAGRKIQEALGQKPQDIITYKMLTGLDGRKMSTSWGNVIMINDEPDEMFGKIMSMHDEQIMEYFELCTDVDLDHVKKIKNPRDAKARLAFEIVKIYHGQAAARQAAASFDKVFRNREVPDKMPEVSIADSEINIIDLLSDKGLVSSKSEARRLVEQGGIEVKIKDKREKIKDINQMVEIGEGLVLKVGKRKFYQIKK